MIGRRKLLGGMLIMTVPGMGGQQRGPINAPAGQATPVGVQPGVTGGIVRVTEIVVTPGGVLEGIFTYSSSPPKLGTLIESGSIPAAGKDRYGNTFLAGQTTYNNAGGSGVNAVNIFGNTVEWLNAPTPGGTYNGLASLTGLAGQVLNIAATALTGVLTVPQPPFGNTSVTALGATWNSTTAAECNGNFNNILGVLGEIISALDASGVL